MKTKDYGVFVAESAGFCPGVKKAIDKVLELEAAGKKPIFTLGPLIHNKQVTDSLEAKGITSIDKPGKDIDKKAVLVIRAHGITPEFQQEITATGCEVADATCPLVKHVHNVISEYADKGYDTVIVGDAGHAEVIGLLGYAKGRGHTVADADEARRLPPFDKVNIVAQTTQKETVFNEAAQIIKEKSNEAVISNTICFPTKQRQSETIEQASNADLVIVVGGRHSANTTRLAKLCSELCPGVLLVENEEELAGQDITSPRRIFITAGASTPNWVIDKVFTTVKEARAKHRYAPQTLIKNLWYYFIKSSVYTSLAAVALTYVAMKLQGILFNVKLLTLSSLFVFSLTVINRGVSRQGRNKISPLEFFSGAAAGVGALVTAWLIAADVFLVTLLLLTLGMVYPFRYYLQFKKITTLPATKDIVTALGWGFVCACVPALTKDALFSKANYLAVFYVTLLVFARSVVLGIGAANRDIMIGKESFYKAFGLTATRAVVAVVILALTAVLIMLLGMGWKTKLVTMLLFGNLYIAAVAFICCYRPRPASLIEETIVDGQFYVLAVLVFMSRFL